MMYLNFFLGTALLSAMSETANASPLVSLESSSPHEPCGKIDQLVTKWVSENNIVPKDFPYPFNLFYPTVPPAPIKPSLAHACLKSVPLHADTALKQIEYLRPIFEWHSTLDYLKNPPAGYLSEGVDVLGELDKMAANLRGKGAKKYKKEFDFLADLYTLTSVRVRDFHFSYNTLLLDLFTFQMGVEFVSISKDGFASPEIFLRSDVEHVGAGYTPSPVYKIDGTPALDFLLKMSARNGAAHDPDARFNSLFPSLAKDDNIFWVMQDLHILHLEDSTKVQLQNGTVLRFDNTALVRGNFSGIKSGADLYDAFGTANGTTPEPFPYYVHQLASRNFTTPGTGYPSAVAESDMSVVRAYLPGAAAAASGPLSDVAVLAVNNFVINPSPYQTPYPLDFGEHSFHETTTKLIEAARSANRSRLIIDLQGNQGGQLSVLAQLYFAFFPGETYLPYLTQFRAHPQFEFLLAHANRNSTHPGSSPPSSSEDSEFLRMPWQSDTDTRLFIQPNSLPWYSSNISSFYGPLRTAGNGEYTSPSQENWTASRTIALPPPGSAPPFRAEDIVLLTDGLCGSACAIFVEMMTHRFRGKVRTVALGGRPGSGKKMQALGMTKGGPILSPVLSLASVLRTVNASDTELALVDIRREGPPLRVSELPTGMAIRGASIGVNLGNLIPWEEGPEGGPWDGRGKDMTPLQFRYEPADYRVFWTWEMMRDAEKVWEKVAEVAWK